MAPEFRYSLTRICLRTGQLSLSQRMAEVFPEAGTVRALDSFDDRELELRVEEPRKVSGLARYLERHRLEVNDQIQIRRLDDGRLALTAMPRARRSFDERDVAELLDSLVGQSPRTEEEIRALYPQIPAGYPLAEALEAHPALRLRGGRWIAEEPVAEEPVAEEDDRTPAEPFDVIEPASQHESDGGHDAARAGEPPALPDFDAVPDPARGEQVAERETARTDEFVADRESGRSASHRSSGRTDEGHTPEESERPSARPAAARRAGRAGADAGADVGAGREPRSRRERGTPGRAAAVTPYPRGVLFPGEAALNSQRPAGDLRLVNRAREALAGFGYRVEGLPHGMLLAKADLGRRKHTVLVRVLADGERLDWAALLARRREQQADYLSVVGDHRDLHRLTAPAELARATLWSWEGIARVQNLAQTILIGPFDLEPHFAKDGMFGNGLHQFERSVGRMTTEKGALSAVIARLASLRAPAVFVLDDLVEGDLPREQVAKSLDLLAQAPFHLVARVDRGEYCLRHTVAESLAHLSEYALSLGERLPGARGRGSKRFDRSESGARLDEAASKEEFELAEEA